MVSFNELTNFRLFLSDSLLALAIFLDGFVIATSHVDHILRPRSSLFKLLHNASLLVLAEPDIFKRNPILLHTCQPLSGHLLSILDVRKGIFEVCHRLLLRVNGLLELCFLYLYIFFLQISLVVYSLLHVCITILIDG